MSCISYYNYIFINKTITHNFQKPTNCTRYTPSFFCWYVQQFAQFLYPKKQQRSMTLPPVVVVNFVQGYHRILQTRTCNPKSLLNMTFSAHVLTFLLTPQRVTFVRKDKSCNGLWAGLHVVYPETSEKHQRRLSREAVDAKSIHGEFWMFWKLYKSLSTEINKYFLKKLHKPFVSQCFFFIIF